MEERCKIEVENLRLRLDKEYEQVSANCQKEYAKVKSQLQLALTKKSDENQNMVKKFHKNRLESQKHAVKCYNCCQVKEYKFKKELCKNVSNHS